MEDRRILRTKRAIREAFITLASQTDINKITVSKLSELADLGRGTFYLHYRDIFDLMESLENEALTDLAVMSEDAYAGRQIGLQLILEATVGYIWENKDIFALLLSTKGSTMFLERFKRFFKDKTINGAQDDESVYSTSYVIAGCLGILQEWAVGGFATPPNKLALIMKNIISGSK